MSPDWREKSPLSWNTIADRASSLPAATKHQIAAEVMCAALHEDRIVAIARETGQGSPRSTRSLIEADTSNNSSQPHKAEEGPPGKTQVSFVCGALPSWHVSLHCVKQPNGYQHPHDRQEGCGAAQDTIRWAADQSAQEQAVQHTTKATHQLRANNDRCARQAEILPRDLHRRAAAPGRPQQRGAVNEVRMVLKRNDFEANNR